MLLVKEIQKVATTALYLVVGLVVRPEKREPVLTKEEVKEVTAVKKEMVPQYTLKVVGVTKLNADGSNRQIIIDALKGDESVELRLDNSIPGYPNCVAVFIGGKQIGNISDRSNRYNDGYAKIFRDKMRKNKVLEVTNWRKLTSTKGFNIGVELVINTER